MSNKVALGEASLRFFYFSSKSESLCQFSILKSTMDARLLTTDSVVEHNTFVGVCLISSRRLEIPSVAE